MNGLACLLEVYGALAACQTAAQNHHGITDLVRLQIVVVDDHHVVALDARQGRNDGGGTHGQDQGIGLLGLHILGRDGGIHPDFYALCQSLTFQCQPQLIHFMLKVNGLLRLENTANLIGLLAENYLMSPLGCGDCGL